MTRPTCYITAGMNACAVPSVLLSHHGVMTWDCFWWKVSNNHWPSERVAHAKREDAAARAAIPVHSRPAFFPKGVFNH